MTRGGAPSTSPSSQAQDYPATDPDLAAIMAAWSSLPEALRAGIVAMVQGGRAC